MTMGDHSLASSHREKLLEHIFIGDLLRCLWQRSIRDVEVLRAEVDKGGYDVVLESRGVLRHVQLKASYDGAKTASVKVNSTLAKKPSGCVIWIKFDPNTLKLGPFLWFGGEPGQPLGSLGNRIAKHTKGNARGVKAQRLNIRVLKRGSFEKLTSIEDVGRKLFGA